MKPTKVTIMYNECAYQHQGHLLNGFCKECIKQETEYGIFPYPGKRSCCEKHTEYLKTMFKNLTTLHESCNIPCVRGQDLLKVKEKLLEEGIEVRPHILKPCSIFHCYKPEFKVGLCRVHFRKALPFLKCCVREDGYWKSETLQKNGVNCSWMEGKYHP